MKLIRIHPADNVAVALEDVKRGETVSLDGGETVTAAEDVARGHKLALRGIEKDEAIVKYGNPIGFATRSIPAGAWVHVHNVRTGLSESADYVYEHKTFPLPAAAPRTFEGYRRADGRAAVRNELWIIPTVGCVNSVAQTLARELADYAGTFRREPIPAGELVVGLKCGGSDGLSGITANPAVGRFSDRLVALGGSTVLTEVPEMFGAENILFSRCESREVFDRAVKMVNGFKRYFVSHGQTVYENPSPGNKAGGITTLEDKSCGCVQKGGSAQIVDVLGYAEPVTKKELNLLSGPGNDLVSATDLTVAGGKRTKAEERGAREISILKDGVVL